MKNLILCAIIFALGKAYSQCEKIYVNKLLSGSPICKLKVGDYIEICEELNEVNGCPYDFYIYEKGSSNGSLTYELTLDKGWPTHYMTLMVNPLTKRFGFILQGQTATYSYLTEAEMKAIQAALEKSKKIENAKRVEQEKLKDKATLKIINSALVNKEYFKALVLYDNLNEPSNELLDKINAGWLPQKEIYNKLYSTYISEFKNLKKEYYASEEDFYSKYQKEIRSKELVINSKEAHLSCIASLNSENEKSEKEEALVNDSYLYTNINNRHLICPIGIDGNYNIRRYHFKYFSQLNINVIYDTLIETYLPFIEFVSNYDSKIVAPIVNTTAFKVNYFSLRLPNEIIELYNVVTDESGKQILEELYPELVLFLNSKVTMPLDTLQESASREKEESIYDSLTFEFRCFNDEIQKELKTRKVKFLTDEFYNPLILRLIKETYPDADSLVFAVGDYRESFKNAGLHIKGEVVGSFVPLIKGLVELKGNKFVIYNKSGNYREIQATIIDISKIDISKIVLDSLSFDSTFNRKENFYYWSPYGLGYASDYMNQYPIKFKILQIGYKQEDGKLNWDDREFYYNSDFAIQLLPCYTSKVLQFQDFRFRFDHLIEPEFKYETSDYSLKEYFFRISKYFEYKDLGKNKKASKQLDISRSYLNSFKRAHLNPVNDPKSE